MDFWEAPKWRLWIDSIKFHRKISHSRLKNVLSAFLCLWSLRYDLTLLIVSTWFIIVNFWFISLTFGDITRCRVNYVTLGPAIHQDISLHNILGFKQIGKREENMRSNLTRRTSKWEQLDWKRYTFEAIKNFQEYLGLIQLNLFLFVMIIWVLWYDRCFFAYSLIFFQSIILFWWLHILLLW